MIVETLKREQQQLMDKYSRFFGNIDFMPYGPKDESPSKQLFCRVFNRNIDDQFWNWYYKINPNGDPIIYIAKHEGAIVGYYALIPMKYSFKGAAHRLALSLHTMVDPLYEGKGIFLILENLALQAACEKGIEAVIGFPNNKAYKGLVKRLHWLDIMNVPTLILELKNHKKSDLLGQGLVVKKIMEFDQGYDDLWNEHKGGNKWMPVKDVAYLNWRYFKSNRQYTVYSVSDSKDQLKGFMAYKLIKINNILSLDLLDWFPGISCVQMQYLLSKVIEENIHSVDVISTWCNNQAENNILQECGFKESSFSTHFCLKILKSGSLEYAEAENWSISMGMSDVY